MHYLLETRNGFAVEAEEAWRLLIGLRSGIEVMRLFLALLLGVEGLFAARVLDFGWIYFLQAVF